MLDPDSFVSSHLEDLDDFWHRQEGTCYRALSHSAYGYDVLVETNDERVLAAARLSASRYSISESVPAAREIQITVIVDEALPHDFLGNEWIADTRYLASGPWMTIRALPHLVATAHMAHWDAVAIVSPALAANPRLLSRHFFDTMTLNMIMWDGLGLVHASCLQRGKTALLLSAPHNTGKSTTALLLAMHGYRLLCDGMTYLRRRPSGLELLGYPVGEAKLRLDVVNLFPGLTNGETMLVREDTKAIVNLRDALPQGMTDHSLLPERIILCHLQRREGLATHIEPVAPAELLELMWPESSFLDVPKVMRSNAIALDHLLTTAKTYRACLGTETAGILAAFDELLEEAR